MKTLGCLLAFLSTAGIWIDPNVICAENHPLLDLILAKVLKNPLIITAERMSSSNWSQAQTFIELFFKSRI